MWYWIGGSAQGFLDKGEIQAAADQQRFISVIPVDEGATVFGLSLNTRWPFDITQSQARMDEEFLFFDDMLACVEQQLHVNQSCVSTVGVSAGALFTDQLAQARSNRLASFVSLSGGVNDTIIKPWSGATHKLPGVVLWGGDGPPTMDGVKDILGCLGLGMDFSVASRDLEAGLVSGGHFFVECRHNCGHVEPPLDTPPGESKYASMWEFAMNHPFWLAPGQSPYLDTGLPSSMPAWCAIGQGNSIPRSGGGCPAAENPCAF
jgi:pimeloyl-ACP methyl ester carboxylesterase